MRLPTGIPFTRAQARLLGISHRRLNALIADGTVTQPLRGSYVVGELDADLAARASAAGLVLPHGAALCRGTVAWLLGVGDVRGPGRAEGPPVVECVVPLGVTPLRRAGLNSYVAPLAPSDVVQIGGLPCTTPERTAADLARWLPRPMGLAVLDALAHRHLVDLELVGLQIERFRGCPGVAVARSLLPLVEPKTESYGESWLRLRIIDAGFPRPQAQIWVHDEEGRPLYRLDLGLPDQHAGFEYDGDEHHGSPAQVAADNARRDRLRQEFGWTVLAFHRGHVLGTGMQLELAVGELLSQQPSISRRLW